MIFESTCDKAASPRPHFDSESTKHGLNASGILLMHFDFAPQYQKLSLGVLLYALLSSFQSLAVPPRFSSTSKKDDGSKRPQWRGPTPIFYPNGTDVTTPHNVSGLDESRHDVSTASTSRVRVACFLNLGVHHVVTATPNSPSKLRRIKRAAAMSNSERRPSASTSIDCPSRVVYCRMRPRPWSIQARSLTVGPYLSTADPSIASYDECPCSSRLRIPSGCALSLLAPPSSSRDESWLLRARFRLAAPPARRAPVVRGIVPPPPADGPAQVILAVHVVSYASLDEIDPLNSTLTAGQNIPRLLMQGSKLLVKCRVPTAGRSGAPTVAGGTAGGAPTVAGGTSSPSNALHDHPLSPAASHSKRMRPYTAKTLVMPSYARPRNPHSSFPSDSNASTP
ncbi:hypothetical protein THAOC_12980 [Thalassiosira oceanica]|uniref:Uncharacterized protein n=1 Tax=Thalassiosira oceanica TaxID=159749 RepID=K0SIR5_THAOC|nr:hypothetical protein THAOC_12980 [Thalassiosira oceanica]|eukprot:EJK66113.1 hypothetical protein THAOC_12980 [Thalassiosira oceanica]